MAEGDTSEKKSPDWSDSLCYGCWEGTKSSLVFGSLDVGPEKNEGWGSESLKAVRNLG
jgi:hypothetical protein